MDTSGQHACLIEEKDGRGSADSAENLFPPEKIGGRRGGRRGAQAGRESQSGLPPTPHTQQRAEKGCNGRTPQHRDQIRSASHHVTASSGGGGEVGVCVCLVSVCVSEVPHLANAGRLDWTVRTKPASQHTTRPEKSDVAILSSKQKVYQGDVLPPDKPRTNSARAAMSGALVLFSPRDRDTLAVSRFFGLPENPCAHLPLLEIRRSGHSPRLAR
ncbi:unnamed protein product [Diplocarpon coronariae]|nr:hypothetical protein JHW43_009074 [Diplocarpon mali]